MTAAEAYQEAIAIEEMLKQLAENIRLLSARLQAMPPMATDVLINFGTFEDYTKVPAPIQRIEDAITSGGTFLVRVGAYWYWVANASDEANTIHCVRIDQKGEKVVIFNNAARIVTGIREIGKYGA